MMSWIGAIGYSWMTGSLAIGSSCWEYLHIGRNF
jgi:hypothetical protein